LVATGQAHFYPRLGPTSEWDTAAAHAVALGAGAMVKAFCVEDISTAVTNPAALSDLVYNQKESLLNPYFLVSC
jgi:3'(2'), 5'-bisphosphate nucleotidase